MVSSHQGFESKTLSRARPPCRLSNSEVSHPMLQAIRNVEITDRSICLPDLLAVSQVRPYSFGLIEDRVGNNRVE